MMSTRTFKVNVDGRNWYSAGLKEISKDKTKIKAIFLNQFAVIRASIRNRNTQYVCEI